MSKKAAEHHRKASEHHSEASRHHGEAANTTRAGITRKRRITLILPTVTPPTLAITLSTQARLIRRSTARSNTANSGRGLNRHPM